MANHVSYQYRQFAGIPKFTGCVAEAGPGDSDVVAWNCWHTARKRFTLWIVSHRTVISPATPLCD